MLLFWVCYLLTLLLALGLLFSTNNSLKKLDSNPPQQTREYAKSFSFNVWLTFALTWGYLTLATILAPISFTATLVAVSIWAAGMVVSVLFSRGAFDRCAVSTLKAIGWCVLTCNILALAVFGVLVSTGVLA